MSEPRSSIDLPNALEEFQSIVEEVGKRPAVFCDYDGTLTEIVEDPSKARLSDSDKTLLARLSGCVPVGIISGRGLADVKGIVGVAGIMYVGSHGLEIEEPSGHVFEPESLQESLGVLERANEELTAAVRNLPGIVLERKRFSVAVHTRRAQDESARQRARVAARAAADQSSGLVLQLGKEVAEIRPAIDWDKGSAISRLVDGLPNTKGAEVIYFGDDRTDEAAFRWLRSVGGVAIVVGSSPSTAAAYQLDDPAEVAGFLAALVDHVC